MENEERESVDQNGVELDQNNTPEKHKKPTYMRFVVTFIAMASVTAMCALMIEMSMNPALAFVLTTYNQILVSALMALVALSFVFRLGKPESKKNNTGKLYFLVLPIVVLDSLLLAKLAGVMFVGHVITVKLIITLALSIIPLALLAPVLLAEIFPELAYLLPRLVAGLLIVASMSVGVALIATAVVGIAAGIAAGIAVGIAAVVVALALLIALAVVALVWELVYHYGGSAVLATFESVAYVSAMGSYQLGFQEAAPDFNGAFTESRDWFNKTHEMYDIDRLIRGPNGGRR